MKKFTGVQYVRGTYHPEQCYLIVNELLLIISKDRELL